MNAIDIPTTPDAPCAAPQDATDSPAVTAAKLLHPLWLTLGAVVLALSTHLATLWRLPLPQCFLRKYAGIPCPTCGCTRSLQAWAQFDLAAALRFNPLFFLLCATLLAWLVAWAAERISGRPLFAGWRGRARRWALGRIFLALAVVNWVYLCLTLPR